MKSKKNIIKRIIPAAIITAAILIGSYLYQHYFGLVDDRLAAFFSTHRIPVLSDFAHLTIRNSFWLPFYCSVILFTSAIYKKQITKILIFLGLLMLVSDYITIVISRLFSVNYAPETTVNPNLSFYNPVKGSLDFAYMHAACAFALVIFFMLLLNRHYFLLQAMLLLWALMIGYNWLFEAHNHAVGIVLESIAGALAGAQAYKIYRQHFLTLKLKYEN